MPQYSIQWETETKLFVYQQEVHASQSMSTLKGVNCVGYVIFPSVVWTPGEPNGRPY